MAADQLEESIGHGVTVEPSEPENQDRDGWTRYQIKCPPEFEDSVSREVVEIDRNGVEIGGVRRDAELMRGANGEPISALGATFLLDIEDE